MRVLKAKKASAKQNMLLDVKLLDEIHPEDVPVLHLYDWEFPSVTYGHFIEPTQFFLSEGVKKHHLSIAKRPTGGGIIFHTCDLAFSLVLPSKHPKYSMSTTESYALINQAVAFAIQHWLRKDALFLLLGKNALAQSERLSAFCMARPTRCDVTLYGKKVGGAAQRRKKQGLLHQGTISLGLPRQEQLVDALIEGEAIFESIQKSSHSLLGENWTEKDLIQAREEMKKVLIESLKKAL